MKYILIILITLLPALLWFVLWRFQDKEKEPLKAMLYCFLLGMLASLPFFALKYWFPNLLQGYAPWLALFLPAFAEEVMKAIMLIIAIEISQRWFTQIIDGLIYASAVALGFAFVENISYFLSLPIAPVGALGVYAVRSFDTMLAHTLFTAFFGFFYASAFLRKEIFPKKKREKPWRHFWSNLWESLPFHVTIFHILPNRPSKHGHYPGTLIFEGILLASLLHGLFNLLLKSQALGTELSFLTVPLVALLVYLLWRMFFQGIYVRIVKAVKG